jgi:GT2 family glycosyltransferase/glycosyltransferase involved in cell wall biosynthesis
MERTNEAMGGRPRLGFTIRDQAFSILQRLPYWTWAVPPLNSTKIAEQRKIILESKLFDPDWYLAENDDVRIAGVDPLLHYLVFGGFEGRRPNPYFDSAWYLAANGDVASAGLNPLVHYVTYGAREGRAASQYFDTQFYLEANGDVAASKLNPLFHFLRYGKREGRQNIPTRELAPRPKAPKDEAWERLIAKSSPVRAPLIDVIVPVYRGYDDTLACIFSILQAKPAVGYELLVIDDCSPDKELSQKLKWLSHKGLFTLLVNSSNSGFVASVNRGMALHPERDIVLLNSDTEVYNDWLDRLRAQALAPKVATVTPFSTNATICSYPIANRDNPEALELDYRELDELCAAANSGRSVDVPTAVGFCMYIRRACLDEVGYFDAKTFGKGYGEENDFCRRAEQAGWRNILAADVFVRHTGEVSFGHAAQASQRQAAKALLKKHPDYNNQVQKFMKLNPAAPLRWRLDVARLARIAKGKAILHVTHNWGGGIDKHIGDLARMFARQDVSTILMTPSQRNQVCVTFNSLPSMFVPNLADLDLVSKLDEIADMLREAGVRWLHIHSLAGWPLDAGELIGKLAAAIGVPYGFTFHDYTAFCPRINLIDGSGYYCGEKGIGACKICIQTNGSPFGEVDVAHWRKTYLRLLEGASFLIAPSNDTAKRAARYIENKKILIRRHPEDALKTGSTALSLKNDQPLRVITIGAIGPHKGSEVLLALAQDASNRNLPIEFTIIGYTDRDSSFANLRNVTITGRFSEALLPQLMKKHAGHIAFLPSVCPETYSYVLSVALAAGYPIAAFDLGSIAERLKKRKSGNSLLFPIAHATQPSVINDQLLEKARGGVLLDGKVGLPKRHYTVESYYHICHTDYQPAEDSRTFRD